MNLLIPALSEKNIPNEIWVVKINPTSRDTVPDTPEDIIDRRNEMIGNESLFQDLQKIENVNNLMLAGAFKSAFIEKYHIKEPVKVPNVDPYGEEKPYHIPLIEMSDDLQRSLYYASRINRSEENVDRLIQDGERQGEEFLRRRLQKLEA